jgi:hypothetical protein
VAKRKGESVLLQCTRCKWSTELPLQATEQSAIVPCTHCGASIHWHRCEQCSLCYVGEAEPRCPICDDTTLDELDYA